MPRTGRKIRTPVQGPHTVALAVLAFISVGMEAQGHRLLSVAVWMVARPDRAVIALGAPIAVTCVGPFSSGLDKRPRLTLRLNSPEPAAVHRFRYLPGPQTSRNDLHNLLAFHRLSMALTR